MLDLDQIVRLYKSRLNVASATHGRWRELARVYDGGLVTPLPEFDEVAESAIPGIITQGVDSYARRFAETTPAVRSPALRPNIASSKRRATERTQIIRGWWQNSVLSLANYQRGRYFFGYGAMPAVVRSSASNVGVPTWEALNPMSVLPGPKPLDYSPEIPDCFMAVTRSLGWLADNYGVDFGKGPEAHRDRLVEVIEFIDAEQVTVFCLAPRMSQTPRYGTGYPYGFDYGGWGGLGSVGPYRLKSTQGGGWCIPLSSTPNYAGMCTVSHPGAISLSKVGGLVDGILGMHKLQARVMSLWVKGIVKGIYPDQWVVTDGTGQGIVVQADGLRGIIGQVEGGQVVMNQIQPGYQTPQLIDRLESNQRSTAGVVPQFGGFNPTNVRTGRASDTVSGAAVDPTLAEAHEIMQVALEQENRIAVAVAKGYGGSRMISMYFAGNEGKQRLEYRADEVLETDETSVQYSLVGADAQGLIIASAQSVGTEMMSKDRARTLNPFVQDPDAEAVKIRAETAEGALLGSLAELVAASPEDASFILRKLREGDAPEDVWDAAQRRAQERQASAGPVGAPDGPVPLGDPAAQPGLGIPGEGGEAPVAVEQPPPSARNLAQLMTTSRRPAMVTPAERAG